MHHISWYGTAVAVLLGIKLLLSIKPRRRPRRRTAVHTPHTIHAVITGYNEDPTALRRCLQSVLDQTR
ncbi:hypothetical protein JK364_23900 [Streptomyces sp. 110]|uniref:Glycosyl transferase n=1 Tax=Streptomyces endocoffeicus TaxID=2898945 RepID=A0ABS1PSL4_9ACTN|nr:hypothetical protein [Streptomyces endocoffeicus]MBL1115418.1 hypothetical protein [Streptomyces endocoffeicus]